MREILRPKLVVPVVSAFTALMAMICFGLIASGQMGMWLRLFLLATNSSVILLSLSQWIFYIRQYIDYKFQELEKEKIV